MGISHGGSLILLGDCDGVYGDGFCRYWDSDDQSKLATEGIPQSLKILSTHLSRRTQKLLWYVSEVFFCKTKNNNNKAK